MPTSVEVRLSSRLVSMPNFVNSGYSNGQQLQVKLRNSNLSPIKNIYCLIQINTTLNDLVKKYMLISFHSFELYVFFGAV